jgi:hypothetical protein
MLCLLRPLKPERVVRLRNLCVCNLERLLMPIDSRVLLPVYTGQIDLI